MKSKTRKILTRIGAGLMLGLSLFNFGAAWKKSGQEEVFKRARQIRKKEKEELKPETQSMVNIAEQEATAVIQESQRQEAFQVKEVQRLNTVQVILRYGVIGVWIFSAGTFFTSMIFNYPFALGKGILSLLPGVPHVATLKLETEKRFFSQNEEVIVLLKLSTSGEKVVAAKAALSYNPEALDFIRYESVDPAFDCAFNVSDLGNVTMGFQQKDGGEARAFSEALLVKLYFQPKNSEGSQELSLIQSGSEVLKRQGDRPMNILGKVEDANFRIIQPGHILAKCRAIDFDPIVDSEQKWKIFSQEEIPSSKERRWVTITEDEAFICGYDSNRIYLLAMAVGAEIDRIALSNGDKEIITNRIENIFRWNEGQGDFIVFAFDRKDMENKEIKINLFETGSKEVRWPEKGSLIFELE